MQLNGIGGQHIAGHVMMIEAKVNSRYISRPEAVRGWMRFGVCRRAVCLSLSLYQVRFYFASRTVCITLVIRHICSMGSKQLIIMKVVFSKTKL